MSQVATQSAEPVVLDPYEIGWYVESADEDVYGPVSRKALRRFLLDKTITPNTLIRHCTQAEARPAADQPTVMDHLQLESKASAVGDRLAEAWPKKTRDRQALAEDSLPCAWHKQPAVAVCVRCHAPYCNKCRMKPFRKQFFQCKRCQSSVMNRRFLALIVDTFLLVYFPLIVIMVILAATARIQGIALQIVSNLVALACVCILFVRDSLFGGASVGKRACGLRVVQAKDGKTPLTFGQGVVRWLSQILPFFNLVDAMVPYSDPLLRRFGDRWAGTRVIDSETKLFKDRQKLARRLIKKGVQPPPEFAMTMEGFARLA